MLSLDDLSPEHVAQPPVSRINFTQPLPNVEETHMVLLEDADFSDSTMGEVVEALSSTMSPIAFDGYRRRQCESLCDEMDNMDLSGSWGSSSSAASSIFSSYDDSISSAASSIGTGSSHSDKCKQAPPRSPHAQYASLPRSPHASPLVTAAAIIEPQDHHLLERETALKLNLYGKPADDAAVFSFNQELSPVYVHCALHTADGKTEARMYEEVQEHSPASMLWMWNTF